VVSSSQIQRSISEYLQLFPDEKASLADLYRLVSGVPHSTARTEFRGHITCSACVIRDDCAVLMVVHPFLAKRLFPGGHVEDADSTLRSVALRELREETTIQGEDLWSLVLGDEQCPMDIDRHPIPANHSRGEPEHEHWDFRFPFLAREHVAARPTSEISTVTWVPIDELPSRIRCRIESLRTKWDKRMPSMQ
jgi:8-oxo-dGTP pyrophosphatase MutT (NUDIX family)